MDLFLLLHCNLKSIFRPNSMEYAIVDIETSGRGIGNNRITEICIVRTDGDRIMDKFVSLVNPQCRIPNNITALTGIDDPLVRDAPLFEEIAAKIVRITEGAVFVAHNVSFDYGIVQKEFRNLGYKFRRKKLCTVALCRKLMPGQRSYSLGKLCSGLGIPLVNRHRAEGDTDATVILFRKLRDIDKNGIVFDSFLNSRKTTLAPNIDREAIGKLPQRPGVYYFKNAKGKIIYVGKAIRIKERVLSHFYDKGTKEFDLCQAVSTVDFYETGNELIALLLEAHEIRRYYPMFNVAQKKVRSPYCLIHYTNQKGIIQFAMDRSSVPRTGATVYYRREEAMGRLREICGKYNLCPRFTGLQSTMEGCSHYEIMDCNKVCEGREPVEIYNIRARAAMAELTKKRSDYAILCKGRTECEQGFVLIRNNIYQGYGFYCKKDSINGLKDLENYLTLRKDTYITDRIITGHINTNENCIDLMTHG